MSDAFWIALFAGVPSILGALATTYITIKAAQTAAAANAAAALAATAATKAVIKVEEVKHVLSTVTASTNTQLAAIAETGEKVHKLCNSAMMEQKKLVAVSARAKADVTKDAVDLAMATAAEKMYTDHVARNSGG